MVRGRDVALADVRFVALCGLQSGIARSPKRARTRTWQRAPDKRKIEPEAEDAARDGSPQSIPVASMSKPGPAPAESRNCRVSNSIHLVAAPPDILYIRRLARVQGSGSGVAGSGAGGHQ
jgi:hypothetical protein